MLMGLAETCSSKFDLLWSNPLCLRVEEVRRLPGGVPGVYVLLAFTPDRPVLVPFYVGQSGDLARRLRQHLRSRDPVIAALPALLSTYAVLARVDDVRLRLAVEGALISDFFPAANERIPSVSTVRVNHPSLCIVPD
jgi:hypothetical protein